MAGQKGFGMWLVLANPSTQSGKCGESGHAASRGHGAHTLRRDERDCTTIYELMSISCSNSCGNRWEFEVLSMRIIVSRSFVPNGVNVQLQESHFVVPKRFTVIILNRGIVVAVMNTETLSCCRIRQGTPPCPVNRSVARTYGPALRCRSGKGYSAGRFGWYCHGSDSRNRVTIRFSIKYSRSANRSPYRSRAAR